MVSEQKTENEPLIDWMPPLTAPEWAIILASFRKTQDDFLCIGPTGPLSRLRFLIETLECAIK